MFLGKFIDEIAGEDYVTQRLTTDDIAVLGACATTDVNKGNGMRCRLVTSVETFIETCCARARSSRTGAVSVGATVLASSTDTAVVDYAVTATGRQRLDHDDHRQRLRLHT